MAKPKNQTSELLGEYDYSSDYSTITKTDKSLVLTIGIKRDGFEKNKAVKCLFDTNGAFTEGNKTKNGEPTNFLAVLYRSEKAKSFDFSFGGKRFTLTRPATNKVVICSRDLLGEIL